MAFKFHELAFTDSVRHAQEEYYGQSRPIHPIPGPDALTHDEIDFIQARDSFHIATVSETGSRNALLNWKLNSNPRSNMDQRPPLPPFDRDSAILKVRLAEDGWNGRNPEKVSLAYSIDSSWRNRSEFVVGREAIVQFLTRKWTRELDYRLIKELWAFHENRIAVRFAYEWHDDSGNWFRSYGNENWEFNAEGLMQRRYASINDLHIKEPDRKFFWPLGRRPDDHLGLSQLDL
jgi:uncharacterized protein